VFYGREGATKIVRKGGGKHARAARVILYTKTGATVVDMPELDFKISETRLVFTAASVRADANVPIAPCRNPPPRRSRADGLVVAERLPPN